MCKLQHFGVQIQAFGFTYIELVAFDGAVQSERVGGMHPKLVGASGAGIKGDTGTVVLAFQYFKVCYSRLPYPVCTICRGRSSGVGHNGSSTVPAS